MAQNYTKILRAVINHIEQSKLRAFSEVNKALLQADLILQSAIVELPSPPKLQTATAELPASSKLQDASGELSRKLQPAVVELLFGVSWTSHIIILNMANFPEERLFYLTMCAKEKWKVKELKRQINSSLFERYMNADKPEKVTALIPRHKEADLVRKARMPYETESIGLVLCKSKNREEVRFALAGTTSPLKVATYRTKLPDTRIILKRLAQLTRRKELEQ